MNIADTAFVAVAADDDVGQIDFDAAWSLVVCYRSCLSYNRSMNTVDIAADVDYVLRKFTL